MGQLVNEIYHTKGEETKILQKFKCRRHENASGCD